MAVRGSEFLILNVRERKFFTVSERRKAKAADRPGSSHHGTDVQQPPGDLWEGCAFSGRAWAIAGGIEATDGPPKVPKQGQGKIV